MASESMASIGLTELFVIIAWIALCFWPASVAARKGQSFTLFFIFALFFLPAALIVAYLMKDNTSSRSTAA